jgi:fibronectin type 3 domain-containing protein/ribosomal protein S6
MDGGKRTYSRRVKSVFLAAVMTVSIFLPLFYSTNDVYAVISEPTAIRTLFPDENIAYDISWTLNSSGNDISVLPAETGEMSNPPLKSCTTITVDSESAGYLETKQNNINIIKALSGIDADYLSVDPDYYDMTDSQWLEIQTKAIEITAGAVSDYAKVEKIHDWITKNIYYDIDSLDTGNYIYLPYDVFTSRKTICEGYSNLNTVMLRSIGIPTAKLHGKSIYYYESWDTVEDPNTSNHAWNAVYADERWFYVDTTWDTFNRFEDGAWNEGTQSHEYFDPNVDEFSVDHRSLEIYDPYDPYIHPTPPTSFKAASAGYNSNKLTWTAVTGATGYSIYRSTSATGSFTYLKGVTGTSYTDTSLTTGTTYYYQIKAYVMVGTNKVMSSASATVNAKPAPAKPTGLKAVSTGYNSNKLTWNAITGATGYSIYRSTSPDSGFTYLKGVTGTSYTNTGLTTGTTYYYQIKAYVMVGTNKVMSPVSATVSSKPIPAMPTGLKATIASTTSIKVSWNTVAGATGYSIYRSTSPDSGFTYLKGVTTTSYTNTGLTTGTTYYYKVRAYTMVGTTKVLSAETTAVGAKP